MHIEEKLKIHSPGHENHGPHVCHKCGWPYPNPHPSARHRRAHKKHCGKIEGFKLIGSGDRTHSVNSDDELELSDDDHSSPATPIGESLKLEESKKDEKCSNASELRASRSEEELFSDAVAEFEDTGSSLMTESVALVGTQEQDICGERKSSDRDANLALETTTNNNTLQPNGITNGDQIRNPDALESTADKLDSSVQFQDHVLYSTADSMETKGTELIAAESSEDSNSHACYLPSPPETEIKSSVGNMDLIEPDKDAECNGKYSLDKSIPAMELLLNKPASDTFEVDSKSHTIEEFDKVDVPSDHDTASSVTATCTFLNVTGEDTKELDPNTCNSPEEQIDALGQKTLPNDAEVKKGNIDEIVPIFFMTSDAPLGDINETESAVCKDHGPVNPEVSPPSVGAVAMDNSTVHLGDPVFEEAHSEFMSNKSGESVDVFASTMRILEDRETDGEGVAVVSESDEKVIVIEGLGSHGSVAANGESMVTETATLDDSVVGLSKIDAVKIDEIVPTVFTTSDVPVGDIKETKSAACKDHGPVGAVAMDNSAIHLGEPVFEEACSGFMSNKSGESMGIFASTMRIPEDKEMDGEGAAVVSESEEKVKVIEDVESHGSVAYLDAPNGESMVTETATLYDLVVGSREIDAVSHSEENKCPPGLVEVGGSITMSIVGSEVHKEKSMDGNGFNCVHEEKRVTCTDLVGDYSQEGGTEEILSKTKIHANPRMDEHEGNLQLSESNTLEPYSDQQNHLSEVLHASLKELVVGKEGATEENSSSNREIRVGLGMDEHESVVGSNEMNSNTSQLEDALEPSSDQQMCQTEFLEGSFKGLAVGKEGDTAENSSLTREINEDVGMSEQEKNVQLTESSSADTVVCSNGMDTDAIQLKNILEPYSDQQKQENENFQESVEELAVDSCTDPCVKEPEVRVEPIETDSRLSEHLHEEPKLNQSSEVGSLQSNAKMSIPEDRTTFAVDAEYCVQSSVTLEDRSTKDFVDRDASDLHYQSSQQEGDHIDLNQQPIASVVAVDTSADSISQTDSVEGYWGSVSDGTVPSMREATDTPMEEGNAANSKQQHSDNTDLFEAPSFMTLVEAVRGDTSSSTEIQPIKNSQHPNSPPSQPGWFPSLTHVVNESQGRKKNEEIIAKVVNWSSGKPRTALKSLLVEANLESKQTAPNAVDQTILSIPKEDDKTTASMAAPMVSTVAAAERIDVMKAEWNSPARLPISKREKRKVKGKQYWVPFVCCSSVN